MPAAYWRNLTAMLTALASICGKGSEENGRHMVGLPAELTNRHPSELSFLP